ncbi:MAG: J domain-containing protein [Desulfobacteraceae bacterium]|jgi:DnaJ-class molecular chaperone
MTVQACLHILGLDSIEDHDQIHRAYRRQVKCWHPDQFTHQPEIHARAQERLKRINYAYSTLKEYLDNPPSAQSSCNAKTREAREEKAKPSNPKSSATPFNWKQWFNPKQRRNNHGEDKTAPHDKPSKTSGDASKARGKKSFERILRQAAGKSCGQFTGKSNRSHTQKRYGEQMLLRCHRLKRKNKNMRIEGHASAAPITAVKPISKIRKIEGS